MSKPAPKSGSTVPLKWLVSMIIIIAVGFVASYQSISSAYSFQLKQATNLQLSITAINLAAESLDAFSQIRYLNSLKFPGKPDCWKMLPEKSAADPCTPENSIKPGFYAVSRTPLGEGYTLLSPGQLTSPGQLAPSGQQLAPSEQLTSPGQLAPSGQQLAPSEQLTSPGQLASSSQLTSSEQLAPPTTLTPLSLGTDTVSSTGTFVPRDSIMSIPDSHARFFRTVQVQPLAAEDGFNLIATVRYESPAGTGAESLTRSFINFRNL